MTEAKPAPVITLRPAQAADAPALSALALHSKAHWGYDTAFMQRCRAELMVTPDLIARERVTVATSDGAIAGFYTATRPDPAWVEVEHLFVAPDHIGTGVGRRLFADLIDHARAIGAARLGVDSDPHAAAFYRRMGCIDDGAVASSSIPGRRLPRLILRLDTPRP